MFRPLSLYIGLRYTRAKRSNHFISFISLVSMLGIALGVTVLITILSVLNGFDREIKHQIFGMISPITISSFTDKIDNWNQMGKNLALFPGVSSVSPFVSGQAILTNTTLTQPVMLIGVEPTMEKNTSDIANKIIKGNFSNLSSGNFGIVIGEALAKQLGVIVGDQITVATIKGSFSTTQITPLFKRFSVVGIFRTGDGGLGFNSKIAYINLYDAQKLFELQSAISGFHININNPYSAPRISQELQTQFSPTVRIWDWTEQLGSFFENIRQTKTMMFFIFVLIIAVAVFNLISTMIMVVKSKQSDIAILRTIGATPGTILAIFVIQGVIIGLGGIFLGIIGGVALAFKITVFSTWIQHILHVNLISSDIYFVNYLPSVLQWPDVWVISLIALALCLLATLYPAWSASKIEPVEALRYD